MSKPSKSPNFTALEKSVLLELIESRKDIIENKQNDGKMVLKKNSEWEKITTEFNASHGVNQRTCIQLKSLWKNMKSRTKSAVAKDRRERTKTGGGPQSETGLDTVSAAISTMLPQQINSLSNEFDDDASLHGDVERTSSTNEAVSKK
ncbi:myb/SANT-like DNA-binding domain-containing protein 3 [Saccostrea cucullata]|uniref:myb/SANT-like DNA-binding domain-containing protein 3 n=1 Tax=Saccostrea cuccullata TaxID=36930 RepID=UPI002ED46A08